MKVLSSGECIVKVFDREVEEIGRYPTLARDQSELRLFKV